MAKEHEPEKTEKTRHAAGSVEMHSDPPEQSPKAVPLVKQKGPDGKDADAAPVPPTAATGPLPRLVHQNERAPAGTQRFKIRCDNYHPQPVRYVLVRKGDDARASAREYYLKSTRLDTKVAQMKENAAEPNKVELPQLVVVELID